MMVENMKKYQEIIKRKDSFIKKLFKSFYEMEDKLVVLEKKLKDKD